MARKKLSGTDPFTGRKDPLEQAIIRARAPAPKAPTGRGPGEPGTFRTQAGRLSGFETPTGTFLGASPKQVREAQARMIASGQIGGPLRGIGEIAGEQRAQREGEFLAGQVGQIGPTGAPITDILDFEQAAKSALGLTAAGIAGGAATGAAAGLLGGPAAPITVPAAAIIGAVIGGVSTFVGGFRSNLKTQRKDILSGKAANVRKMEQNLLKIVMDTNQGGDPIRNLGYFNEQLSLIDQNEVDLNFQTKDDLSLWLGEDGHTQLERYETFNTPGGMRDILIGQMQQAILNPDPSKIINFSDIVA